MRGEKQLGGAQAVLLGSFWAELVQPEEEGRENQMRTRAKFIPMP